MKLLCSTNKHKKYWAERKIDWNKAYTSTWNHPHRFLISGILRMFTWMSLFEIGCGSGPNLINIVKSIVVKDLEKKLPGRQLGGCDINKDAIEALKKNITNVLAKVGSADDIMMSDDSTDVVLSDMCLIYAGPLKIDGYIREIKRIARNYVIFCEFHNKSFWQRLKLRLTSGYNSYDYEKLLHKHGFYDVVIYKIPEEAWPGGEPQRTHGCIIKAKVPRRKLCSTSSAAYWR